MTNSTQYASHQPDGNSPSFFGGLIVGGLLGAIAALLFAPQSGEQTREQLTKAGEDAIAQGQRVVEDARERAEAIIADAQRRAERIAEAARSNVSDLADTVETELTS
jgi:gas vesicle protein